MNRFDFLGREREREHEKKPSSNVLELVGTTKLQNGKTKVTKTTATAVAAKTLNAVNIPMKMQL